MLPLDCACRQVMTFQFFASDIMDLVLELLCQKGQFSCSQEESLSCTGVVKDPNEVRVDLHEFVEILTCTISTDGHKGCVTEILPSSSSLHAWESVCSKQALPCFTDSALWCFITTEQTNSISVAASWHAFFKLGLSSKNCSTASSYSAMYE